MKIYTSKSGRKFAITKINKPAQDGVVFFLETEWLWLRQQIPKPTTEEFNCIWELKREDHNYNPIPEADEKDAKALADKYATEIIEQLRKGKNSE